MPTVDTMQGHEVDFDLIASEYEVERCRYDESQVDLTRVPFSDQDGKGGGKKKRKYDYGMTEEQKRAVDRKRDSNYLSSLRCEAKKTARRKFTIGAIKHVLRFMPRLGSEDNPTIASMIRICKAALKENGHGDDPLA